MHQFLKIWECKKKIVKGILLRNGLDDDQKSAAKKLIRLGPSVLNKHEMGNL